MLLRVINLPVIPKMPDTPIYFKRNSDKKLVLRLNLPLPRVGGWGVELSPQRFFFYNLKQQVRNTKLCIIQLQ